MLNQFKQGPEKSQPKITGNKAQEHAEEVSRTRGSDLVLMRQQTAGVTCEMLKLVVK